MNYTNRLAQYFAEMDTVAKTDPVKALKLKSEHLKPFHKPGGTFFCDKQQIGGLQNSFFVSSGPAVPFNENYIGGFTCINGRVYDDFGNEIELPGDDEFLL